jgi:hypothetical protein
MIIFQLTLTIITLYIVHQELITTGGEMPKNKATDLDIIRTYELMLRNKRIVPNGAAVRRMKHLKTQYNFLTTKGSI